MEDDDLFEILPEESRRHKILNMGIGEAASIARRIDISFGISNKVLRDNIKAVRGSLDQQASRARRMFPEREYRVENGSFVVNDGALVVVAICTRLL